MDDTTQSRTEAAATRKRRSSILKSQRPPRTPFCELEFNVCTPTDTNKSRRVSFSRKTGVAEFVANEATTTWTNLYEQLSNKSQESSGNDLEVNPTKQRVSHLGTRIFDQQFEDVEFELMGPGPGVNTSTTISNMIFPQQMEHTDSKLLPPQNNFELSAFTEQSKFFADDLAVTCPGETFDHIDINISAVQRTEENDDLNEIQKDLMRQSNVVCHGPYNGRQNVSEYIEVDLNTTHAAMNNEESDMSITDTISSPKVQDVSKSISIEKKVKVDEDWVADKENIVMNPYIAPRESINFAVNEEPDKVLVFDGKRLIVETEQPKSENYRQTLIPNMPEKVPQRKTLVLNCNDDLPNFIENAQVSANASGFLRASEFKQGMVLNDMSLTEPKLDESQNKLRTILFNDDLGNISVTDVVPNVISSHTQKRRTIVYENETGNISITQPVPSKIIDKDKRKTIIYDNSNSANISTTQVVPANLVLCNENNEKLRTVFCEKEISISFADVPSANIIPENTSSKRRTIVFDDVAGNVSFTQTIPSVIKDSVEARRTVLYEDKTGNISVTQAITSQKSSHDNAVLPERVRTVVFERDTGHVSVTQALPSKIILPNQLNATSYEDNANISVTQVVPTTILIAENSAPNRRRTVVYEDDTGNLSITQAVPLNQVIQGLAYNNSKNTASDIEIATNQVLHNKNNEKVNANKDRTVVFESDDEDISMTQAVNLNRMLPGIINKPDENFSNIFFKETTINKSQTIMFQNDNADISITRAVPMNQIISIVNEQDQKDTDNVAATNIALHKKEETPKRRTIVFENEDADISMTQAVPMNQVIDILNEQMRKETDKVDATNLALHPGGVINKRRTIVFENENADISMTQAVPMNQVIDILNEQMQKETDKVDATNLALHPGGVINKRRTIVFENENADISMTQAVPMNQIIDILNEQKQKETDKVDTANLALHPGGVINKRRTMVFENEDISMTQAVPMNQVIDIINEQKQKETDSIEATKLALHTGEAMNKRRTIVFDNEDADISITQMVHLSQVLFEQRKEENQNVTENDFKEATCAALHLKDEPNAEIRRRTVTYDDDAGDNIPTTQSILSNIPQGGQVNSKSIVFEDVSTMLKNKDIFMEVDKLTEDSQDNEDMEALDVSMADVSYRNRSRKTIAYENDTNMSVTKAVLENLNPKVLQDGALDETANKTTSSKPIPAECYSFQYDMLEKSYSKPVIEHDDNMLVNAANISIVSNVVVYQAVTEKQHIVNTATGDLDDQIADENEEYMDASEIANKDKISSGSKTPTNEQTDRKDDEQAELKNVCLSAVNVKEPKESGVPVKKSSMLNELLDMTQTLFEDGIDDKGLIVNINNEHPSGSLLPVVDHETDSMDVKTSMESKRSADAKISMGTKGKLDTKDSADTKQSTDTLFFITKDSIDHVNTDNSDNTGRETNPLDKSEPHSKSHLAIKFADEQEPVKESHKKLFSIKSLLRGGHSSKTKNHHLEESVDKGNKSLERCTQNLTTKSPETFKMANDTKELLDMISDLTEKPLLKNLSQHLEEEQEISEPILVKGHLALENKKETSEPELKKLSSIPKRQSIALTREEILKNMSMASATLQKSRFELNESDMYDDEDTVNETPSPALRKTSLRLSKDVVKTLHFEGDDSLGETEQDQSNHATPLKKTAFGEISYMKETKSKVIPTYLNVSDGIKELMDDLVKPMADVLPFETSLVDKSVKRTPSTCSIQMQTNLLTSSQIDLHTELLSTTESACQFNKNSSDDNIVTEAINRSMSRAREAPIRTTPAFAHSESMDVATEDVEMKLVKYNAVTHSKPHEQPVGKVLIFDHDNPLNNVFLAPPVVMEVHSYNPVRLEEKQQEKTLNTTCPTVINDMEKANELKSVTTQFCIESRRTTRAQSPETVKVSTETQSQCSNISKLMSDQFTEPENNDVKDTEVNTIIVMRGNKELLDASSSLTLVDDTLIRSTIDLKMDSNMTQEENADSPLEVIYTLESESHKLDSDLTSSYKREKSVKPKKRLYSPTKRDKNRHCTLSSLETSPMPAHKMQKRSFSPDCSEQSIKLIAERDSPKRDIDVDANKTLKSSQVKKPGTTITVQQVMTMVHVEDNQNNWQSAPDAITEESPEELENKTDSSVEPRSPALSQCEVQELASSEMVTSFTSSKNLKDDRSPLASPGLSRMPSRNFSRLDWVPESASDGVLKSQAGEIESATNIITRIDMMPFMGSHDCEWDSSAGDTWSFLLLHSRLRLAVQFQREPRLAPDTPVLNVALETMHYDKKNPIATLCVKYAAEVMRFFISRGCGTAADVPKLVRQLAAAARLAARWARAMHDARARLAYTLTPDGWLELKVANTSLRLVWEVTLQVELVVEDARSAPWPRACGVRVSRVLPAGPAPAAAAVARVLRDTPRDWGHAPRTLWKIFRYLKYKKRDDDMLQA